MKDISFLIYTNENYFNLLYLTFPYFKKNTEELSKKTYIVSNKIPKHEKFDNVTYIDANVNFEENGSHFRNTMLCALNQIKEDYVLFLCDDYLIKSPFKKDRFDKIIDLLTDLDIDYLSLGSQKHYIGFIDNFWKKPNIDLKKYNFPENCLYEMNESVKHLYSVQPCIWKKTSLIELLENNENLSLHYLDNTLILTKDGKSRNLIDSLDYNQCFYEKTNRLNYGFKNYCFSCDPISFNYDERDDDITDFLFINYCEIVRHGKFMEQETNSKRFLDKILNLPENKKLLPLLKRFI